MAFQVLSSISKKNESLGIYYSKVTLWSAMNMVWIIWRKTLGVRDF